MTENKAVELLEYIRETGNGKAPYVGCAQNIAIDMAIQALEKQIPKKPIDKLMYLECPTCGDVGIEDCGYCSVCGQKLDWGNENDGE